MKKNISNSGGDKSSIPSYGTTEDSNNGGSNFAPDAADLHWNRTHADPTFRKFPPSHDNGDDEKVCRICLEEDSPETMIAPCRCKGGSRWVHRECLDEWRTNERDRAFSKCTECLFEYYLQPVHPDDDEEEEDCKMGNTCGTTRQQRRKCLFYGMVSRDVSFAIVFQQLIVILLGTILWAWDEDRQLVKAISTSSDLSSSGRIKLCYYAFGWFAFLIILGVYGSILICTNGCDLNRAIPRVGPPSEARVEEVTLVDDAPTTAWSTEPDEYRPINDNYSRWENLPPSTQYYRRARRRNPYYRRRYYNDNCYFVPYYNYWYPMYVYPTGNHGCCCCCCCCDSSGPPVNAAVFGRSGCCSCDFGGCLRGIHGNTSGARSDSSSVKDNYHILLVVLLVVAIVLAIIGFFTGVVIIVIAVQRIVGRHIHLLQKRQLVQEFQVLDLQDYDLDKPLPTAPTAVNDEEEAGGSFTDSNNPKHPPPSAPFIPDEDTVYLQKLGLMER